MKSIATTDEESYALENETINQTYSKLWHLVCLKIITSSNVRKVLIRKRNFESLVDIFLKETNGDNLPKAVKENVKHRKRYEPIARENYHDILFYLNRDCAVSETGCIFQPNWPWLLASPC